MEVIFYYTNYLTFDFAEVIDRNTLEESFPSMSSHIETSLKKKRKRAHNCT